MDVRYFSVRIDIFVRPPKDRLTPGDGKDGRAVMMDIITDVNGDPF